MNFQKESFKCCNKLKAGIIKTTLICFSLFVFLSLNTNASTAAEITDISNRRYYPAVKEALDKAQSSIDMAMFVVSLSEDRETKAASLLRSLVDASQRGVEVKVILDKNINFFTGEIEYKNKEAYRYLKKRGVNVLYDDIYIYTHNKILVIDGETVVVGSTNWSQTALAQSNESALLIKSPQLAEKFLKKISNIKLYDSRLPRPINRKEALHLSKSFLENRELAGTMAAQTDERAFDLYLLLLYTAKEENRVDFDFDKFAELLQISEMSTNAYRRQIIKTLRKLKDRYNLIDVQFRHGKNAQVTLLDSEGGKEKYEYPFDNYFFLPSEYFKYGWDRTLSFRAKFCYMINLYKYRELNSRFWSLSLQTLSKKFNLDRLTIGMGMNELRRHNIIDTVYAEIDGDYEKRKPAKYELLGLYCPREQEEKLSRLSKEYGQENLEKARDFAEVVFRENDIEAIEEIIILANKYGRGKIKRAYEILSKKRVDNPKRTFRYAIGIIKGLRDEEIGGE
jgi:HKD family nuclease